MNSIYIEMAILATCFAVTLGAVWLLHRAERKINALEAEVTALRLIRNERMKGEAVCTP